MSSIKDVAKLAGVGVSTVSKVMNNYDNISVATREKVMAAVDTLDYIPNTVASALSSKSSRRVALVVFINNQRQAIDEINMQYLFGAISRAKEKKLEVLTVFSTDIEGMNTQEVKRHFQSLRVQSIVLYGLSKENEQFHELIRDETFPCVVVDAPLESPLVSYVTVDHTQAQYDMMIHMIERYQATEILYLAGRRNGYVTDLRLQGAVDACLDKGIKLNAQYANFSELEAMEITKQHAHSVNAIVCASDLMAIGAVSALKAIDIFRPVCGYDGITLLGYIDYKIETVKQDFFKISELAIDAMIRLLDGHPGEGTIVPHKIITINYEDVIM